MRKSPNVQAAKEEKQPQEDKLAGNVAVPVPNDTSESTRATRLPFDVSAIDPGKIAMAEKFGIPIGQILSWASDITARLDTLEQTLPKMLGEELQKAIDKAKSQPRIEMAPVQQGPPPNNMSSILGLIPQFLNQQPQNDMLTNLAMESLKARINMSKAIEEAVVSKITAKATDDVASAVTGE